MKHFWQERNLVVEDGVGRAIKEGEETSGLPLFEHTEEQIANKVELLISSIENYWTEKAFEPITFLGNTFNISEEVKVNILGKLQVASVHESVNGAGTFSTLWRDVNRVPVTMSMSDLFSFGLAVGEQIQNAVDSSNNHVLQVMAISDSADLVETKLTNLDNYNYETPLLELP